MTAGVPERSEVRRLVEIQSIVDGLTDPGPLIVRPPFATTGRTSKADLARSLEMQQAELDRIRDRQAKIVQGLVLLLQRELPS